MTKEEEEECHFYVAYVTARCEANKDISKYYFTDDLHEKLYKNNKEYHTHRLAQVRTAAKADISFSRQFKVPDHCPMEKAL